MAPAGSDIDQAIVSAKEHPETVFDGAVVAPTMRIASHIERICRDSEPAQQRRTERALAAACHEIRKSGNR